MTDWDEGFATKGVTDAAFGADTIGKVRRVVAANSLDAADCRGLLAMLGLDNPDQNGNMVDQEQR